MSLYWPTGAELLASWRELTAARAPGCWWWFTQVAHNGDVYAICSLAEAFRATHGAQRPIRLVLGERSAVPELFAGLFAEVLHRPEFNAKPQAWSDFLALDDMTGFGPDRPISIFPYRNPELHAVDRLADENAMTWMQLYKSVLRLPPDAEPMPPPRVARVEESARATAERLAIEPGRSVILSPGARTLMLDSGSHFAALAVALAERGYRVFTNVGPGEEPVPGTTALTAPLAELAALAEQAGWFIGFRSGACDVVAAARARKTVIFAPQTHAVVWALDTMDLCRDAEQLVFDFTVQSPESFVDLMLAGGDRELRRRRPAAPSALLPAPLASESFVDRQRAAVDMVADRRGTSASTAGGLRRLTDLPVRSHPRWGEDATAAIAAFVARSGVGRFFALRDRWGLDAVEEVEPAALLAGCYRAADFWHTVLHAAPDASERVAEVPFLAARLLPLPRTRLGQRITVAEARDSRESPVESRRERPLQIGGVQLMSGWGELEEWGVWALGARQTLKIGFADPPVQGFVLTLGLLAIVPEAPLLVSVNRGAPSPHVIADDPEHHLRITVSPEQMGGRRSVEFGIFPTALRTPHELHGLPDMRALGAGLRWVAVEVAQPA